jgi:hypothetical protein
MSVEGTLADILERDDSSDSEIDKLIRALFEIFGNCGCDICIQERQCEDGWIDYYDQSTPS